MAIPLFVVTTYTSFGELIRRNLEESGQFIIHITDGTDDAERHAREKDLSLAFLDTDISDEDVIQAGRALHRINKPICFIITSKGGWHAVLEELSPYG